MTQPQPLIRVGLVGLGFMAATHIKAYQKIPGVQIAALCNPSGRNLDGNLTNVGGNVGSTDPLKLDMRHVKAYRSYEQMLADPELDLIDICTPTPSHPDLAVAALEAGRHVICEKPLARNATLARRIADAAARSPGFIMPAMCLRFWPEWAWLKSAIDENRYGKALSARFRRVAQPPAWGQQNFFNGDKSGGALLDLHIHDTDFVQFCFGRPHSVYSTGYTKFSGAIDHVVTQYRVASETIVHAEGSWAMADGFGFNMSYTVNFENATADYDLSRGADALKLFVPGQSAQVIRCEKPDGFIGELSYLADCIRAKQPPKTVTIQDGVSSVEICEAEEQSIRCGEPVALS